MKFSLETALIHPHTKRHGYRALACPIYQTSTYENRFMSPGVYSYTRVSNPTRHELEAVAGAAEGGRYASAFSSGLAAVASLFSIVPSGGSVLAGSDIYGGTYRLLFVMSEKRGVTVVFADPTDAADFCSHITKEVSLVFIETPTNPLMKVADIGEIARRNAGRAILVCDNTFLTPVFQKPLALGADAVVHSATKYLCGHHDATAGLVITNRKDIADEVDFYLRTAGSGLSPFDSFLVRRGMETLVLRMERHAANAMRVNAFLRSHPLIEEVLFVGDPNHPQYEISKKQTTGCGGMISFRLNEKADAGKFISALKLITFAESLGGNASLITHPYTQTHASLPEEVRLKNGVTPTLLRLSCGTEAADDIISDIAFALDACS